MHETWVACLSEEQDSRALEPREHIFSDSVKPLCKYLHSSVSLLKLSNAGTHPIVKRKEKKKIVPSSGNPSHLPLWCHGEVSALKSL